MVDPEKFYNKLIDKLSSEIRDNYEEYQKKSKRHHEVFDLLKDKTIPFADYVGYQKELEKLEFEQQRIAIQKDSFCQAREIIFDLYEEMKKGAAK